MKTYLTYALSILALGALFLLLSSGNSAVTGQQNVSFKQSNNLVRINNTDISVEVASTTSKMALGLSGRDSLKDGEGMWFIFERPEREGFWMKGMNFPIDIIWLDENGMIVSIKSDAKPSTFPEIFYPSDNALYVLEVPANFVKNHGFEVGDVAKIHP